MRRIIGGAVLWWLVSVIPALAQQSINANSFVTSNGNVYKLPSTTGSSGFVMSTDGSGVLSWVAPNGGSSGSPLTPPLCPWAAPTITGTTYYVDNSVAGYNGSSAPTGACATADAAAGTSTATAWCTIARVMTKMPTLAPGDGVLFKGGDTWTEQMGLTSVLGTVANPIVFSSYGTGRWIIDAAANNYGINACNAVNCNSGGGNGNGSNHDFIINNVEVKHALKQAITFQSNGGTPSNTSAGTPDSIFNVDVRNSFIHNSGPNVPASGAGVGSPAVTYNNQLDFESFSQATDNTHFYCNTVQDVGGWNAIEVHYDTGAVQLKGNIAGTGGHACGPHGCIDVKGIGSVFAPALVYGNTASCGLSAGVCSGQIAGFYLENTNSPKADVTYQNNLSYDNTLGFQIAGGYATCTNAPCAIQAQYYNNTGYISATAGTPYGVSFDDKSGNANSVALTLDIRNNIIDGGPETVTMVNGGSSCTFANYNNQGGSLGKGTLTGCMANAEANGQTNVNPLYQNVSAANFQLQPSSTDLNAGLAGLTSGNNNIGAFGTGAAASSTIYPGTAPTAGQLPVGNAGGTAYAPQSLSGDCTVASTGAITCTKINGTTPGGTAPANNFATNISASGVPTYAQPAFSNLSGTATLAQAGTGLAQVASQQVTTAGTAVAAGTTQAQTGVTITGLTTTSSCTASVPTALPATWQTGIFMSVVVTANTATLELTNPTALSITPVAQAVNIKCVL